MANEEKRLSGLPTASPHWPSLEPYTVNPFLVLQSRQELMAKYAENQGTTANEERLSDQLTTSPYWPCLESDAANPFLVLQSRQEMIQKYAENQAQEALERERRHCKWELRVDAKLSAISKMIERLRDKMVGGENMTTAAPAAPAAPPAPLAAVATSSYAPSQACMLPPDEYGLELSFLSRMTEEYDTSLLLTRRSKHASSKALAWKAWALKELIKPQDHIELEEEGLRETVMNKLSVMSENQLIEWFVYLGSGILKSRRSSMPKRAVEDGPNEDERLAKRRQIQPEAARKIVQDSEEDDNYRDVEDEEEE